MALSLDDLKQFALDAAGASDNGQAPPALPNAPMPNIQSQGGQIANSINTMSPQMSAGPQTPQVQDVQPKQGPIKSFLSQFIYGAGQGLLNHVGLQTDAQKQQVQFGQQQAQASAQRAQQLQQAQIQNYQSEAAQRAAGTNPVDLEDLNIPGLSGTVMQKDLPKVLVQHLQNQGKQQVGEDKNQSNLDIANLKYGDGSQPGPLNTVIKDIGGRSLLLRKGTGEVLKDLGESNTVATAGARARAMAQYGIVNTMDQEGNPTSISRLDALSQGAPTASFDALKQIGSDKVGIGQYESILRTQIAPNLSVLNDPTQRAIIAHTLSEADKNPGAIQSLLTSGAQQGLSPQGAALAAGILQGREFGSVARKYGGNMNGTEGLMNRITANQASPLNSEQLNRDLIQNDLTFTGRAQKQLAKITSHTSNVAPVSPAPTTTPTATHRFNPVTGKIEAIQ